MTKVKIRIRDDAAARSRIDAEYEKSSRSRMCRFASLLSEHIFQLTGYPEKQRDVIREALQVNEQRQRGTAGIQDVRRAAFRVHQLARESRDDIISAALRTAGHAVAAGHMKEHAMVASDYAVKVINLLYPDDMDAVRKEREWQLDQLKAIPEESEKLD